MPIFQKIYAKLISQTWKNLKLKYYLYNYLTLCFPKSWYQKRLERELKEEKGDDIAYIAQRVNYYNKISKSFVLQEGEALSNFRYRARCKSYFFDMYQTVKYFPNNKKVKYKFGDVTSVSIEPTLVKSRPINSDNKNSVLLKLNKIRHFVFVKDKRDFEDKKFKLLWRGNIFAHQKNRMELLEKFAHHPLCDIRYVNSLEDFPYPQGKKLTLYDHLKYQFILSLEGNDVATNLKWILSSSSVAVMPKPKYETWFMEGTLIPNYHYILVKDDFSDLIEKVMYYHKNPIAAKAIIRNANEYVRQFQNKKREKVISLLVLKKYFELQK